MGLRKGCPLSLLLFILAADDLLCALYQAQHDLHIAPFMEGPNGPMVSHLLFVDDCILLDQANVSTATIYASIIQNYCQASRQKVNLQKSMMCFSPKTSSTIREAILDTFGILNQSDRLSYLGIPITGRRPRCCDYSDIERRVRERIDGWQVTGLSMMARIILLRSLLTSLPLYLLSNAVVPITCLRRIDRCFRDFLWASMQDGHGIHLQAWDSVCKSISEGGLGIKSLIVRRDALLARHAFRFIPDLHCFWSSFIRARYGEWTLVTNFQFFHGYSFF